MISPLISLRFSFTSDPLSFAKVAVTGDQATNALRIPNSHAFVDLDTEPDFAADLMVTSVSADGAEQFEVWKMKGGFEEQPWEFDAVQELPAGSFAHIGQSSFADIGTYNNSHHFILVSNKIHNQNTIKETHIKAPDQFSILVDKRRGTV